MFKIALVGHSQMPHVFEAPEGAEIRIFRRPGDLVHHFKEPLMVEVFDYKPDMVILFLKVMMYFIMFMTGSIN